MSGRIRWLGVVIVLCFVVLFLQLNNLQVVKAKQYATASDNPAQLLQKFNQPRGVIQSADGVILAQSLPVKNPCASCYKYQRQYPMGPLFAQITGFFSYSYGSTGIENTYNQYLATHNRPVKTLRDLLTTPSETDEVTLTLSTKLQQVAQQLLAGKDGAIVALDPTTGAVLAMYSNPTYDPNPLAVNDPKVETQAYDTDRTVDPATGFSPLASLAFQDIFQPGSTFKTVTTAAAYDQAPKLVNAYIPYYTCIPPHTLLGQTTELCNSSGDCGGTIAEMLPPSCDTGFAILGTRIGATSMTTEADGFGFNQQPPIDLPHSPFEVSQFLQPGCYQNAQVFLAFSSIGQKCTLASPLQMALVAAAFANGGLMMTPHVMYEIRDQYGNLVERYQPTPWHQATSLKTADAVRDLMVQVVRNGTASSVGFPPQDDVAAKTGTAQVGVGNTNTTDWMIAFAPASAPRVAIAVALPNQPKSAFGATAAGPLLKAMIEAALAGD